jgi:hypothetical protein
VNLSICDITFQLLVSVAGLDGGAIDRRVACGRT